MPRLSERLMLTVVPFIGSQLIRLLAWSIRFTRVDAPVLGGGERGIFTFWHGRILMMPKANTYGPFTVMVSRHRDGEIISRTVKWLGIESSRGSTTRGGSAALKDVIRMARRGFNIAFTPDGPRGPRHAVQMGTIQAAKATGLTIYPVTYSARKKKL